MTYGIMANAAIVTVIATVLAHIIYGSFEARRKKCPVDWSDVWMKIFFQVVGIMAYLGILTFSYLRI